MGHSELRGEVSEAPQSWVFRAPGGGRASPLGAEQRGAGFQPAGWIASYPVLPLLTYATKAHGEEAKGTSPKCG